MHFHDLLPTLQVSIGPVIVISGVGLLLLSMTNRFGRVIDRVRQLSQAMRTATPRQRERLSSQLQILARRGRLVRLAITLAATSVLLAAVLIITLFLTALFQLEVPLLVTALFIACMAALIVSLIVFIRDINLSLAALWLEIEPEDEGKE